MGLSGTEVITTGSSVMSSVLVSEMRLMTYSELWVTSKRRLFDVCFNKILIYVFILQWSCLIIHKYTHSHLKLPSMTRRQWFINYQVTASMLCRLFIVTLLWIRTILLHSNFLRGFQLPGHLNSVESPA